MSAYEELMIFVRDTQALGQVAGRLGWDQETMMPPGAAPQRAEEHGALASVLHGRRTDPRIADWLERAVPEDDVAAANIREIKRSFERSTKVPERLATELAKTTSLAHRVWADARQNEDVAAFVPMLEKVVQLRREEAAAIAGDRDPYDALIEDYEPGTSGAEIANLFDALRAQLVPLRQAILDQPAIQPLDHAFDEAGQLAVSDKLAEAFGYDKNHGRIDKAVHPFSSGSGLDVRITTRTNLHDPFNCFYSTIHEVGHAAYEQGIDHQHLLTPLGRGVSMGVHESQSRIYENQLARSRPFTGWLFGKMRDQFGDFGIKNEDAFYACVNRVSDGFIRTEADEVQYNLHVMLRFDLERALVSGDLLIPDLEAAWNDRFKADFGYTVDKPSNGLLQDVHWSEGLFGYFPTYTLGNVYAGCLYEKLRDDVPDLDDALSQGQTTKATGWLRENLQQFGGFRSPKDTIVHACGQTPSEAPLLSYLDRKFSDIYGLK